MEAASEPVPLPTATNSSHKPASGASTESAGSSTVVRRAAKIPKQQPKAESKGSLLKNVAWLVGATALGMLAASQVAAPRRAHPKRRV